MQQYGNILINKLQTVAKFHKAYEHYFLQEKIANKKVCLDDPLQALFLIFSFSFYQGRRDKLSKKYENCAKYLCKEFFTKNKKYLNNHEKKLNSKDELKLRYSDLETFLGNGGLNKEGDRLMVVSLINFIQSNREKNIVQVIIEKIKSNKLLQVYEEMDDIWSIGSKISSLVLRDIVYIYELEKYLKDKRDYQYLQPVDTWVHKIAKKLNIIDVNKDNIYPGEPLDIILKCFESGVNPIHFNQGAWYIGTHSLEILFKNFDKIII